MKNKDGIFTIDELKACIMFFFTLGIIFGVTASFVFWGLPPLVTIN